MRATNLSLFHRNGLAAARDARRRGDLAWAATLLETVADLRRDAVARYQTGVRMRTMPVGAWSDGPTTFASLSLDAL